MIAPLVGLYVVLATSSGVVPPAGVVVDGAGVEVLERIVELQTGSGVIARRRAARALGSFDWLLHPEAAEALATALLDDPRPLVRQQAAASLARMKPGLPMVHLAVAQAAQEDSCLITRHAAKRALKALDKACNECPPLLGEEFELGPTVRWEPSPPLSISPFAPGAEQEVPAPAPVPPPLIHPEDALPLVPPEPGFDRYDLHPTFRQSEAAPDASFEIPADIPPRAGWPTESFFPPAPIFPRPNYASSLLGI